MIKGKNQLILSDLHIPYENPKALELARYCRKHYGISTDQVYSVGDEIDSYFGSMHPKSPEATHSPRGELTAAKEVLKAWYATFPQMKLCISNHGLRWLRKASNAEIPSQLLRSYESILEAPRGWKWRDHWIVPEKHRYGISHGMGYSGRAGAINCAVDRGMSWVIGHLHSHGGIHHLSSDGRSIWAANAGCLLDPEAYAFDYGKYHRNKPTLGLVVVVNRGSTPLFIPL